MYFSDLKSKTVLVIGTHQGIGAAIVKSFLAEGSVVIAADIAHQNQSFEKISNHLYHVYVDVAQEKSLIALVRQLEEYQLVPDIFVDVAGISTMDFLLTSQTSDYDRVQAINARGVYLSCKYIVGLMGMFGKRGRVIIVSSQAGKNGYQGMSAYVASKHAVLGLTKTLAIEVASQGILVNAVCPGIIETQMKHRERIEGGQIRKMTADEVFAEDQSQVPLGRTGQPQDVANVVLFLASPLASYMTGQSINVTGGMTMH